MGLARWVQFGAILFGAVLIGYVIYSFAPSSQSSERNRKVSESLIGYYSKRGGEYSYIEGDFFKMKNITAITMDNKSVVLDVAILSDKPKDLYLDRNNILVIIRTTLGKTSTVTYRHKVNLDNIKMVVGEEVFSLTGVRSEVYLENLYYF